MRDRVPLYDLFGRLVSYPEGDYLETVHACRRLVSGEYPKAATMLACFGEALEGTTLEELAELYTRTFEINPLCALEVGWHLFGENYTRGEMLVAMRHEMRRLDLPESTELPDHLRHALEVLARIEEEQAVGLATDFVLPAVEKMLGGLRNRENPFRNLLGAIHSVLSERHRVAAGVR